MGTTPGSDSDGYGVASMKRNQLGVILFRRHLGAILAEGTPREHCVNEEVGIHFPPPGERASGTAKKWQIAGLGALLALILLALGPANFLARPQGDKNVLIFDNQSGRRAVIKVIGPTENSSSLEQDLLLASGERWNVSVPAGSFYVVVRYSGVHASDLDSYVYSQAGPIQIQENPSEHTTVKVTLHGPESADSPQGAEEAFNARTVRVNSKDGLQYVWIPAGSFTMGCPSGWRQFACGDNQWPAHRVTITRSFWLASTEVTVGAYKRFVAGRGSGSSPDRSHSKIPGKLPPEPIIQPRDQAPGPLRSAKWP